MIYFHWRNEQEIMHPKYGDIVTIAGNGGSTICMEPIQGWYFDQLKEGDFLEKKVGMAKCHPDDTYCKKTGREEALKRAKVTMLTVKSKGTDSLVLTDELYQYMLTRRDGPCNIIMVSKK
jgi:hypothetical protein